MGDQPILHTIHRRDLIYMPAKYYQNISKGIKFSERTSFCLRTDGQTDAKLIALSPEPCWLGGKKDNKDYITKQGSNTNSLHKMWRHAFLYLVCCP